MRTRTNLYSIPSHGYSGEAILNAGTSVTKTCVDESAGRAGRSLEAAFDVAAGCGDGGDDDEAAANGADEVVPAAGVNESVIGCSGMGKREANT